MFDLKAIYSTLNCEWNQPITDEKGVVIACDFRQEWMLPWWHRNYSKHNTFPLLIVDIGMTDEGKETATNMGKLVQAPPLLPGWFMKPFTILASPFKRTLWIDTDCLIRGNLQELLSFEGEHLGLRTDICYPRKWKMGCFPNERIYNTGVIPVSHNHPAISQWAYQTPFACGFFRGDQEILSRLLYLHTYTITELDPTFNNLRLERIDDNACITHFTGPKGKELIRNLME